MSSRRSVVALAAAIALACLATAWAAELTPEAAYALAAKPLWSREVSKPEDVAAARKVLEAQAAKEPETAKWVFALGRTAAVEAGQASGDAAKAKRKEALGHLERAVAMQPGNADYLFWLGNASFESVDDVGMLSKMSLVSTGRKAFEKALAIDPGHVASHVGLAQFYTEAPGIAGGSIEKAKAEGRALLAIPGKRGEYQGHIVLAGIAAQKEDWAEMSKEFTAAETAEGDGADPVNALRSQAFLLLTKKKDPQAALPIAERYVKTAPADDLTALFLDGEIKRQLGRCADALPRFDQVLAKRAEARGSRWGAAVCREELGQKDAARRDYEEYARRFPDDARAKEAKAAAKRLSGS
jgi:tetratricopeptide (TPR) repeat protein